MAKILVIDDDTKIRGLISGILERAGHTILEAVNGLEGLSVAAGEHPDLVICDLMMPVMGGLETIRVMRKDKGLSDLPVIVITCNSDKQTITDILDLGISYFFAKPIDFAKLKNKVQEVLNSGQSSKNEEPSSLQVDEYVKRPKGEQLVVICESNKNMIEKLVEALESDYKLMTVADGASCLNAIFQNRPDVVLIEFESAVLSASEVTAKVKNTPALSEIRVITFVDPTNQKEAASQSELFDKLIPKPYSIDSILDSLQEVLGSSRTPSSDQPNSTAVKLEGRLPETGR